MASRRKWEQAMAAYLEAAYRDLASEEEVLSSDVYDGIEEVLRKGRMSNDKIKTVWDAAITRIELGLSHDRAWDEISSYVDMMR